MPEKLPNIDAVTAKTWLDQGRARLFDIREADEFRRERIETASLMPPAKAGENAQAELDAAPEDREEIAIFYCNSGQRTGAAASEILACGYREVYALKGGLAGWKAAGFETKLNPKAPISLQRQVQIAAGGMIVAGLLLAWLLSPWFALLSGFVGMGLVFAGVTNTCALARLLGLLPYNRRQTSGV